MTTARPVSASALIRALFLAVALPLCGGLLGGCATTPDVGRAKANGVMGTARIYAVTPAHALALAKTVFAESGVTVQEHTADGYLAAAGGPLGTVTGAWIDRMDDSNTRVTVYTEQKIPFTKTKLTEELFHQRFAQALAAGK